MKIDIETIDSCNRKLKLEIPLATYQQKLKAYYKKLSHEVSVPGFRKGKVPQAMLEKRFGPEVKKEVLTQLVSDSLAEAIEEKNLKAIGEPRQLNIEAEEGTDITVTADLEVVPEFEIADFSKIDLTLKVARVTDEDIDKVVEVYRERNAKSVPIMDRGVETGDLVKIDFEGSQNGKPVAGTSAQDYVIQVGSKNLIEGFDENLMGMNVGEVREFNLKLSDQHPNTALASQAIDFKVTLKGIQIKEIPESDDELAKKADPEKNYQTVAEMREGLRKGLEEYEKVQARKNARVELAAQLGALNPIDIPERLVQEQIGFMVKREQQKEAGEGGAVPHEDGEVPVTPADEKKHREDAVKLLQQELVIGKLAENLEVEVTNREIDQEIAQFMNLMGGGDLQKVKQEWAQSGALLRLHTRLRREKTLDALFEKIDLKEEMVDREALKSDN